MIIAGSSLASKGCNTQDNSHVAMQYYDLNDYESPIDRLAGVRNQDTRSLLLRLTEVNSTMDWIEIRERKRLA